MASEGGGGSGSGAGGDGNNIRSDAPFFSSGTEGGATPPSSSLHRGIGAPPLPRSRRNSPSAARPRESRAAQIFHGNIGVDRDDSQTGLRRRPHRGGSTDSQRQGATGGRARSPERDYLGSGEDPEDHHKKRAATPTRGTTLLQSIGGAAFGMTKAAAGKLVHRMEPKEWIKLMFGWVGDVTPLRLKRLAFIVWDAGSHITKLTYTQAGGELGFAARNVVDGLVETIAAEKGRAMVLEGGMTFVKIAEALDTPEMHAATTQAFKLGQRGLDMLSTDQAKDLLANIADFISRVVRLANAPETTLAVAEFVTVICHALEQENGAYSRERVSQFAVFDGPTGGGGGEDDDDDLKKGKKGVKVVMDENGEKWEWDEDLVLGRKKPVNQPKGPVPPGGGGGGRGIGGAAEDDESKGMDESGRTASTADSHEGLEGEEGEGEESNLLPIQDMSMTSEMAAAVDGRAEPENKALLVKKLVEGILEEKRRREEERAAGVRRTDPHDVAHCLLSFLFFITYTVFAIIGIRVTITTVSSCSQRVIMGQSTGLAFLVGLIFLQNELQAFNFPSSLLHPPSSILPSDSKAKALGPLKVSPFDDFSSSPFGSMGGGRSFPGRGGGSPYLQPGTPVYIGSDDTEGVVVGQDAAGYVIQVPTSRGPVLVRRPARDLYVRSPSRGGGGGSSTAASSSTSTSSSGATRRRSSSPQQGYYAEEQEEEVAEGDEASNRGPTYQLYKDPRSGKTYVVYDRPPQPQLPTQQAKRLRMAPSRDQLKDLFTNPSSSPQLNPMRSRGVMPGFDFVRDVFEDGLSQQQQQQQQQQQSQARSPGIGAGVAATGSRRPAAGSSTNEVDMLKRLAQAYMLNGRPEEAQKILAEAYRIDENRLDDEMLGDLAETQHRQGRLNEAMSTYRKALDLNEQNSRVALRYGVSLHDQGAIVPACNYYYKAIQLDPKNTAAYNNLGVALQELGQLDSALHSYKKALEIDGLHSPALQNLAALTVSQGRFKLALACIQRALLLNPKDPTARKLASEVMSRMSAGRTYPMLPSYIDLGERPEEGGVEEEVEEGKEVVKAAMERIQEAAAAAREDEERWQELNEERKAAVAEEEAAVASGRVEEYLEQKEVPVGGDRPRALKERQGAQAAVKEDEERWQEIKEERQAAVASGRVDDVLEQKEQLQEGPAAGGVDEKMWQEIKEERQAAVAEEEAAVASGRVDNFLEQNEQQQEGSAAVKVDEETWQEIKEERQAAVAEEEAAVASGRVDEYLEQEEQMQEAQAAVRDDQKSWQEIQQERQAAIAEEEAAVASGRVEEYLEQKAEEEEDEEEEDEAEERPMEQMYMSWNDILQEAWRQREEMYKREAAEAAEKARQEQLRRQEEYQAAQERTDQVEETIRKLNGPESEDPAFKQTVRRGDYYPDEFSRPSRPKAKKEVDRSPQTSSAVGEGKVGVEGEGPQDAASDRSIRNSQDPSAFGNGNPWPQFFGDDQGFRYEAPGAAQRSSTVSPPVEGKEEQANQQSSMNPYQRDGGRESVLLTNDEEAAGAAAAAGPSLQAQQQQQSGRMRDGRAGEEVFLSWEDVLSALAAQGRQQQQEQAAKGGEEEAERPTDRRQPVSENERPIAGKAQSSQASQQEETRSSTATTAPKIEEELQQEQFKSAINAWEELQRAAWSNIQQRERTAKQMKARRDAEAELNQRRAKAREEARRKEEEAAARTEARQRELEAEERKAWEAAKMARAVEERTREESRRLRQQVEKDREAAIRQAWEEQIHAQVEGSEKIRREMEEKRQEAVRRAIESERQMLEVERQRAEMAERETRAKDYATRMAAEREVMAKQAAWEAFRSKQRQAQAEEWHQHEEALQARRRRVERGLGLDLDEAPDFAASRRQAPGESEGKTLGYGGGGMMGEGSTSCWGDRGESFKGEEEGLKYPIEKSAAIPFMITRDMRRQLIEDMNYSRKEVDQMKPEEALEVIQQGISKPRKPHRAMNGGPVLDRGFYDDDGSNILLNEKDLVVRSVPESQIVDI